AVLKDSQCKSYPYLPNCNQCRASRKCHTIRHRNGTCTTKIPTHFLEARQPGATPHKHHVAPQFLQAAMTPRQDKRPDTADNGAVEQGKYDAKRPEKKAEHHQKLDISGTD